MGLETFALVFQGIGMVTQAIGGAAGQSHAAAQARRQETAALIRADQVDTAYRDDLRTTIANIKAIRASAGGGDSPTERAVIDEERRQSDRRRKIDVGNERLTAGQMAADARHLRWAARASLIGGLAGSLPTFARAGASMAPAA